MKVYLLRIVVLLFTFALGVGMAITGRYIQRDETGRAEFSNQKPFVLVIKKRANGSAPTSACQ
jgi:hypothetical protein